MFTSEGVSEGALRAVGPEQVMRYLHHASKYILSKRLRFLQTRNEGGVLLLL